MVITGTHVLQASLPHICLGSGGSKVGGGGGGRGGGQVAPLEGRQFRAVNVFLLH